MYAAKKGHTETVKVLVSGAAALDTQDEVRVCVCPYLVSIEYQIKSVYCTQ